MARRDEAAELCLRGLSPSLIAQEMGVSPGTVEQYLNERVGAGILERSDLLTAALVPEVRLAVEQIVGDDNSPAASDIQRQLTRKGLATNDFDLRFYLNHRGRSYYLGDLYRYIAGIEMALHGYIEARLSERFGSDKWWREIPIEIRKACVTRREEDEEPADEWSYSTFIELKKVFEKHWSILADGLPLPSQRDRRQFLSRLERANLIRNRTMHPTRGLIPNDEDLSFVRTFHADLQLTLAGVENDAESELSLGELGQALMDALRQAGKRNSRSG